MRRSIYHASGTGGIIAIKTSRPVPQYLFIVIHNIHNIYIYIFWSTQMLNPQAQAHTPDDRHAGDFSQF